MYYTLKIDNVMSEINSVGAEMTSFIVGNDEYIWSGKSKYWSGHAPHLFPIVCAPYGGGVEYDGKMYPMPKHGMVMSADFRAIELGADIITLENSYTDETLKVYPYRYKLRVTHKIWENKFSTDYEVIAIDDLVFNLGGHPGFNCPKYPEESFDEYCIEFANASGAEVSITNEGFMDSSIPKKKDLIKNGVLSLKYSDFDNDALIVEKLKRKKVDVVSKITGSGIRFEFDGFDALGIWTPAGLEAPFICLEPWCGLPGSKEEGSDAKNKKYAKSLKAGESFRVGYSMTIL